MTTDPDAAPWAGARLHIVTGKGGTGKTTVASALALALASARRTVLLAEVEGRQGISQTFDVPPLGTEETRIAETAGGGEVVGLSIDAKAALLEYLQIFYKLGRAGRLLEKFGAIDFATTIAPGVRDVLLIGKVYEANRRRRDGRHRATPAPAYDAIVLDAPPTGRIGRFLSVNSEVADLARVGPIHCQADSITALLTSAADRRPPRHPARGDAGAGDPRGDRRAARQGPRPRRASSSTWSASRCSTTPRSPRPRGRSTCTRRRSAPQLAEAGVRPTPELVDGLLDEARDHAAPRRPRARAARAARGHGPADRRSSRCCPSGVDAGSIRELADLLVDAGMVRDRRDRTSTHDPGPLAQAPPLDVDALIADPGTEIVVCCGSGGVGKTTTAAALGLRAAEQGRKVVVLTIDPARRLAQSLGPDRARQHPPSGHRHRHDGRRHARRDDARHEADLRRGRPGPLRARARPSRSSPTPSTRPSPARSRARRSTWPWRSSASSQAEAGDDEPRGTSSSSTPRRRARRSTSSTPRSGSGSFLDGRFIRLLSAPAQGRWPGRPQGLRRRGPARHRRR